MNTLEAWKQKKDEMINNTGASRGKDLEIDINIAVN
jgi:hypothetical protein